MSGWICSYRKIWDHPIFDGDALRVGVWTWMIHTAAWKDTRFRIGSKMVQIRRGQLCVSHRQICTETGMPHRKLRTFLVELTKEGAITQDTTQGRTIITICKYEEYQRQKTPADTGNDTQPTQSRHTKEQDNNITTSPNGESAAAPPVAETIEVSVLSKAVWDAGKPFLASRGVSNPGSLIGRWLKSSKPDQVLRAIDAAQRSGTQDPIPYITETLKGERNGPPNGPENRIDPALEQIARLSGIGQAPRDGGGGAGSHGQENGPLRLGQG